jgi:hypothetical protein
MIMQAMLINILGFFFCIMYNIMYKGLGAIRAKIGPISDDDKIFSKMYSQYVLFRNNTVS